MVRRVGNRWGIATLENGVVVGVGGHYLRSATAARRIRDLKARPDPANPGRSYRLVRRSANDSPDWGTRVEQSKGG
ncbi:MAG: hypothetical protein QOG64_2391 [Acidimicrobiaceae bacterium]|nr:hypothetical protein [Acidimicrobiaceae bacterium]